MLVGLSPQYLQWMLIAWAALVVFVLAVLFLRPWRSPRKPIRTLFKLSFSLWLLAFFAILAEALFVSFYSTTDAFSLSLVSKRWNERHVHRNNWNCRDDKRYEGEIPLGAKRLAIVGDSFAFGHGIKNIKDRFGDRLEARLNKETKDRWEVYNLAEPGADTGWELERLEALGRKESFRTDVVLLAYCLNDIERLVPATHEIVGSIINDPPKNFWLQNFYLPNFLYYRLNHFRRPEVRGYFGWLKDGYQGEIWEKQKQRLDAVKQWCDERNAKLVVVVFPFMVGLDGEYAFETAHQKLAEHFKGKKISAIDLLPIYRKAPAGSLVVNSFDAHPNEQANRTAAELIWLTWWYGAER
jgi:hypothetical protein